MCKAADELTKDRIEQEEIVELDEEEAEPVAKKDLFAKYKKRPAANTQRRPSSSQATKEEFEQYLTIVETLQDETDAFGFWNTHKLKLCKLSELAFRVLSVPATSAPIEGVFSHGGILMRPHRASMGDSQIENLLLLKCNRL